MTEKVLKGRSVSWEDGRSVFVAFDIDTERFVVKWVSLEGEVTIVALSPEAAYETSKLLQEHFQCQ